jgi:uroporphyrinogen decarboxylase
MVQTVKAKHPTVPLTLYANGSGGLLERIKATGVDVVGIDWTVDMKDARARLGNDVSLQGNVDPVILFASHVSLRPAGQKGERRARGERRGQKARGGGGSLAIDARHLEA